MPTMTPELQAAYNEWLLKFGFRKVPFETMCAAKPMMNNAEITTYEDWQRCVFYNNYERIYHLRTLSEIEIYDKNINNS